MSQIETLERDGMDRRDVIKKAAVAGAIVWAAPVVTSQVASAQAPTCTPKCKSVTAVLKAQVSLYCERSGGKWAQLVLSSTAETACPCGGEPVFCVEPPRLWDKGNSRGYAESVCNVLDGGRILIRKSGGGALGDGTYKSGSTPVKVAVGCRDRSGRITWQVCDYSIEFTFHPGNGSCSKPDNVGEATVSRTETACEIVCTAGNVSCPFTKTC